MMCEHRLGESAHCIIGTLMLVCLKSERWPEGSRFNGCTSLFPPFTAFWGGKAAIQSSYFQKFRNSLDIQNKKQTPQTQHERSPVTQRSLNAPCIIYELPLYVTWKCVQPGESTHRQTTWPLCSPRHLLRFIKALQRPVLSILY